MYIMYMCYSTCDIACIVYVVIYILFVAIVT